MAVSEAIRERNAFVEHFGPMEARHRMRNMLRDLKEAGPMEEGRRATFIRNLVRGYPEVEFESARRMPAWWKAAIIVDDKPNYPRETVQRAEETLRTHVSNRHIHGELEALIKICGGAEQLAVLAEIIERRYEPTVPADEALVMLAYKLKPLAHVLEEALELPDPVHAVASELGVGLIDPFSKDGKPGHGTRVVHHVELLF